MRPTPPTTTTTMRHDTHVTAMRDEGGHRLRLLVAQRVATELRGQGPRVSTHASGARGHTNRTAAPLSTVN